MPYDVRKLPLLYVLASLVLVVACLYWARVVLIPVALALLLTFLLNPVVRVLQGMGLPRVPAVLLIVALTFSFLGGIGWVVTHQLTALAGELPRHTENLKQKIADLRRFGEGGVVERVQRTVQEVLGELHKEEVRQKVQEAAEEVTGERPQGEPAQQGAGPATSSEKPVPVVVQAPSVLWQLPALFEPLATAGLVLVLVIFMLLKYGDLRSRLIRLVGYARLTIATKALDEAGRRISRYLLMQSIINGSYGLAVGLGLFVIGVPYAVLWGFLAAVLRFIPYVGPVVAAVLPSAFSLAVFPGWGQPLLVIGLILVLELAINLIMEPLLYGQSAGVSTVALLVAVAFWTWLWGPIGLFLATPLTVCLGVLGKYIPQLEFIGVLLGDEPALEAYTSYYQRLVARDEDEAGELVDEYLETHTLEEVYDDLLVSALTQAKQDRENDTLAERDAQFIFDAMRAIVEDLGTRQSQTSTPSAEASETAVDATVAATLPKVRILGCPARDEADELALLMLRQMLDPTRYELEVVSAEVLTGEVVSLVEQQRVGLICIAALPPEAMTPTRHLCKRLRVKFPELKIVVGRWGFRGDLGEKRALLLAAGADEVGTTLRETRNQVMHLSQLFPTPEPKASPNSAHGRDRAEGSPTRP
jgi:predicted PurR-regulated permease PerM